MDDRDRLAFYPFVVVRIGCRRCSRKGAYRLARLAAKFGPEITLRDLTERFSYDRLWRAEARSKKGKSACGVYLPDLEHKRPPDLPPEFRREVQPPASLNGLDVPSRRAVFVPWKPSRRRGSEWETRLSVQEPMLSTGLHLTSESTRSRTLFAPSPETAPRACSRRR